MLKRVQAVSYTEVSSDQTHRSRTSPRPNVRRHSRSPNGHKKDAGRDNRGHDMAGYQRHGRVQEVNQDRDLHYNIPPKHAHDRINRRAKERAVHENLRRIEYDAAHGLLA